MGWGTYGINLMRFGEKGAELWAVDHVLAKTQYRSDVVEASYGRYKGEACAAPWRGV